MDEVEEFLMHFGIKGMKWGVRKNQIPLNIQKKIESHDNYRLIEDSVAIRMANEKPKSRPEIENRIAKLAKDRQKIDGRKVLEGGTNLSLGVLYRRRRDDSIKVYARAGTEENTIRIAKTRSILQGSLAAAVIVGGGNVLVNKVGFTNPQTRNGQRVAVGLLGAQLTVLPTVRKVRSLTYFQKSQETLSELKLRQRQLASLDKKKVSSLTSNTYVPKEYWV